MHAMKGEMRDGLRVVLVRHGETAWSREERHTGRTDIPLDDAGRQRARETGERLRRAFDFAAVYCSPLSRARETCALAGLAGEAVLDPDLEEWDYGDYEGRTSADIHKERPGWNLFKDGCPNGESFVDVAARVERVIEHISHVDGDVAVFAHGHVLRTFGARWLSLGGDLANALQLSPAALSVLSHYRGDPVIGRWNDSGHLSI
jgi:broad specificity phosphatase PhoE